jgi:flagellar biosynthesis anti-sigma factor FlgM
MDIRSSLNVLKTLLGVTPPGTSAAQTPRSGTVSDAQSPTSDRATLSSAGSEVAQSAGEGDVRTAKVAEIQAALQGGTYDVPASAVAAKIVDSMLGQGK